MQFNEIQVAGLAPDERAYQCEGGQCAAVRLMRAEGASPHVFGFTACAFAIELDGSPTLTADIKTIEGWHTVSCNKGDLLVNGLLSLEKVNDMRVSATEKALIAMLAITATEMAFSHIAI